MIVLVEHSQLRYTNNSCYRKGFQLCQICLIYQGKSQL